MKENEDESFLRKLKKNVYINLKSQILPIVLHAEYKMTLNFLKDTKTIKTFFLREMHGIMGSYMKNKEIKFDTNIEFYIIFPKNKGEIIEIDDYMINNIDSKKIFIKNYVYKVNLIYREEWENYKTAIFRFIIQNKDKQINKNNLNKNETSINNNNLKNNINDYIDIVLSFYLDINDNSTVLLNEFYYDINENIFLRFYDIVHIYYEKLQIFIDKNFNNYFCNESILINRSMLQIYNYIMTRKLFYNERTIIKDIQKYKDEINIYIDIRDEIYHDSFYQIRCHILKLSDISCFVSIVSLINVKHFSLNKRFITLKSGIILALKLIKKNIENEIIEN